MLQELCGTKSVLRGLLQRQTEPFMSVVCVVPVTLSAGCRNFSKAISDCLGSLGQTSLDRANLPDILIFVDSLPQNPRKIVRLQIFMHMPYRY